MLSSKLVPSGVEGFKSLPRACRGVQSSKLRKGFTLVELLIVIAIIAILSVAVLSTINPIEQANKANDSKNKNDAAEILSAIERYYASKQEYPWMDAITFSDAVESANTAVGFNARSPGVGLCSGTTIKGSPTCTSVSPGLLIYNDELKTTFLNKTFLATAVTPMNSQYIYNTGTGIYVCFVPKAKANRVVSTTNQLYMLDFTDGYPNAVKQATTNNGNGSYANGECPTLDSTAWGGTFGNNLCFICVP